jgi:multiple sugar transport system ATP-binding protein
MGSPAMNLFTLPLIDGGVVFGDVVVPVSRETLNGTPETDVTLGIRPEHLEIAASGIPMDVDVVEELGSDAYVYGRTTIGGTPQQIVARGDWRNPPQKGDRVNLRVDPDKVHIFASSDGRRLG